MTGSDETPTPVRLLRSTIDLDSSVLGITGTDIPQGDLNTADIRAIQQVNPFDEFFRRASAGQSSEVTGMQTFSQSQSHSRQGTPTSLTPTCTTPTCTTPKMREKYLRQSQYAQGQGQGVSSLSSASNTNAAASDLQTSDATLSQQTGLNNSQSAHSSSEDSPQSPVFSPSDSGSAGPPSKLSKSGIVLARTLIF